MILREVTISDLPALITLDQRVNLHPWLMEHYLRELEDNEFSHQYILVNNKNELCGYLGFWVLFENCQIVNIMVDKAYQNKGYGKFLLEYLDTQAKKHRCTNITLEVEVSNIKAIKLYEKCHYQISATRKRYYEDGSDAYLMHKEVK